jgi:hypothetical protein
MLGVGGHPGLSWMNKLAPAPVSPPAEPGRAPTAPPCHDAKDPPVEPSGQPGGSFTTRT